ncbi:hypothetical protein ACFPYJ_00365 [Paenibacillus solisilvae]|uniref:Heparinase n=1 Tax=Paenibacillus solisilvae TaxID=2486751 RepID=A0ABW0VPC5_9BACL
MKLNQADFEVLKKKVTFDSITQKLFQESISQADHLVMNEFPSHPIQERSPIKKVNDQYTDEYLENLQEYDQTSWLYERAFRKLAFAFKMTGKQKYLDKYEQAIVRCMQNPFWGPKDSEYDHCSSRILRSLSVSLTWLCDEISLDTLEMVSKRMKMEVLGFERKYCRMGEDYPIGPNDHQSKDLAGAGCAALFLLKRDPTMKRYLDRFISLFRDKLLEETIEEDGGWPDGWACVLYSYMDVISFFEVIEDYTDRNLTHHPRLQQTCNFLIGAFPQHKNVIFDGEIAQALYPYCHSIFWMAATYRRKDMQFIAKRMILQGLADLDFSDYAFICYDERLEAEEFSGGGAIMTRSVGWGRLGWGTNEENVYLWLKSGITDAFCRNNQNGLLITAFGRQLFSDVSLKGAGYRELWNCVYEDGLWTTKCANALLVNGQNQLRNRYGEDWGPIMKFHNPNRPKWGDEDAWWFDFEAPKAALGRMIGAISGEEAATLVGRADKCYGELLTGYSRTCMMTKDGLIIIIDRLVPTEKAKDFQFRANTAYTFHVTDSNRAAITAGEVCSDILFLYDGDYSVSVDKWPFNPGPGNYLTGNFKLQGRPAQLVTVMRPYRDGKEHVLSAKLQGNCLSVCFDEKWYEIDVDKQTGLVAL